MTRKSKSMDWHGIGDSVRWKCLDRNEIAAPGLGSSRQQVSCRRRTQRVLYAPDGSVGVVPWSDGVGFDLDVRMSKESTVKSRVADEMAR